MEKTMYEYAIRKMNEEQKAHYIAICEQLRDVDKKYQKYKRVRECKVRELENFARRVLGENGQI